MDMAPIAPMLRVPDIRKAIESYKAIGFQEGMVMPGPDGTIMHAMLNLGTSAIHLDPVTIPGAENSPDYDADYDAAVRKGPLGVGVNLYVTVPDVDALHEKVKAAGWTVKTAPTDQFWGDRNFWCVDPSGYVWTFAQTIKQMTPQEMQAAMAQMAAP